MNNVKFIQLIVLAMVIIVFHYNNVHNILIIIVVKKELMEHVVGLWVWMHNYKDVKYLWSVQILLDRHKKIVHIIHLIVYQMV